MEKISQTIVPYLISLICLNSLKELSKVTCLTLLDLPADFETILLERLSSRFGITSNAMSWIKSYLLIVLSLLTSKVLKSSSYQLTTYGVLLSVLDPLPFILYTTNMNERIKYKVLSLTYQAYLHSFVNRIILVQLALPPHLQIVVSWRHYLLHRPLPSLQLSHKLISFVLLFHLSLHLDWTIPYRNPI